MELTISLSGSQLAVTKGNPVTLSTSGKGNTVTNVSLSGSQLTVTKEREVLFVDTYSLSEINKMTTSELKREFLKGEVQSSLPLSAVGHFYRYPLTSSIPVYEIFILGLVINIGTTEYNSTVRVLYIEACNDRDGASMYCITISEFQENYMESSDEQIVLVRKHYIY